MRLWNWTSGLSGSILSTLLGVQCKAEWNRFCVRLGVCCGNPRKETHWLWASGVERCRFWDWPWKISRILRIRKRELHNWQNRCQWARFIWRVVWRSGLPVAVQLRYLKRGAENGKIELKCNLGVAYERLGILCLATWVLFSRQWGFYNFLLKLFY